MSLLVYCINLDRSIDRWHRMSQTARQFAIDLRRVPGVDGAALAPEDRIHADGALFKSRNGRRMLAGEYGCYRSHLLALETFLSDGAGAAVIVEDDLDLDAGLLARAQAVVDAVPEAGLVKLLNHRARGFRLTATTALGDEVGRCLHGPQGSAACYLVTRRGAEALLGAIDVMSMPYDIALERGWETGVATYTVRNNLVELGPLKAVTEIASTAQYADVKMRGLRRLPTHAFRAADYMRRLAYALKA